mmetsp:Transcript_31598/g.89715  ORF Transcript_31598/g.89715 Transcript_31598/m.89715 type:complete len:276 (-) Transcript_31598:1569-2396(-)
MSEPLPFAAFLSSVELKRARKLEPFRLKAPPLPPPLTLEDSRQALHHIMEPPCNATAPPPAGREEFIPKAHLEPQVDSSPNGSILQQPPATEPDCSETSRPITAEARVTAKWAPPTPASGLLDVKLVSLRVEAPAIMATPPKVSALASLTVQPRRVAEVFWVKRSSPPAMAWALENSLFRICSWDPCQAEMAPPHTPAEAPVTVMPTALREASCNDIAPPQPAGARLLSNLVSTTSSSAPSMPMMEPPSNLPVLLVRVLRMTSSRPFIEKMAPPP